jgi:hypothetical protein
MKKQPIALVAALVFALASALGQQDPVNQWGDTITGRMAPFLPKGAPGLIPHEPWSTGNDKVERTWGDAVQNWKYLIPKVEQSWWFDDPVLAQQIAAAEEEQANVRQQGQKDLEAHMAEIQALQKQYVDLVRQGKTSEASAVADKMKTATGSGDAKIGELDDRIRKLQVRGRNLIIAVHGNEAIADAFARSGQRPQPAGTIKGRPIYRVVTKGFTGPDRVLAYLAIYLGHDGFKIHALRLLRLPPVRNASPYWPQYKRGAIRSKPTKPPFERCSSRSTSKA